MVNEATVVRSWKLLNLGDRFIEIHCGTLSNFMYGGNFMFLKKNKGGLFPWSTDMSGLPTSTENVCLYFYQAFPK